MRATHFPHHVGSGRISATLRRDGEPRHAMYPDQWRREFLERRRALRVRPVWSWWYRWLYVNWSRYI